MRLHPAWLRPWLVGLLLAAQTLHAAPQTTAFTYQGSLELNDAAFDGSADFEFHLFDASAGGTLVAPAITRNGVSVDSGVFTVDLDFGAVFGTAQHWLQIVVNGEELTPRQPVTPTPMALYALSGLPGPQGPAGPAGAQGPAGATGAQGPAGIGDIAYGGSAHESHWLATGAGASYASLLGTSDVRPSEERVAVVAPSACTMRDLRLRFTTADSSYTATTVTLMRNGSATALTCAVSLTGVGSNGCTDVANTVAVSPGDSLSLRLQPALPTSPLTNSEAEQRVRVNFGLRCVASP